MKLHPYSVPYRILQSLGGLVGMVLLAGFIASQAAPRYGAMLVGIVAIGGTGAVITWQVAYYRRFEYTLTPDTFDIASGVISRRHREIPYRRIQNVDITRSLVQRAMGIAEVRLETAGGTESEAHLRYVGYANAKRLQNEIQERTEGTETDTEGIATPEPVVGETLFEISDRELIVLGVASFDIRVASFLGFLLTIVAPSTLYSILSLAPVDPLLLAGLFLVVIAVLSGLLSGVNEIINNYHFKLSRSGEDLRYERGLLQRYDGSIPLEKVQTLVVRENVIKRYFGYASLVVETAGYAPGQQAIESASLVPIADRSRTIEIAQRIESFQQPTFTRPARRARRRYAFRYAILTGGLVVLSFLAHRVGPLDFAWWTVAVGFVLAPIAAHVKWAHRGYAIQDDHVVMRHGFWRQQTYIVPYYRVQIVDEIQTILQRRWRIASVVVDTAGASNLVDADPTAFDIDDLEATELRTLIATELQASLAERPATRSRRFSTNFVGD